jgi:hypothetical protein
MVLLLGSVPGCLAMFMTPAGVHKLCIRTDEVQQGNLPSFQVQNLEFLLSSLVLKVCKSVEIHEALHVVYREASVLK